LGEGFVDMTAQTGALYFRPVTEAFGLRGPPDQN